MLGAKDAQVCGMSARARTSAHAGMRSSARKHVCNHTHKHASNHARGHANNRAHVCQQSCIQACTRACMKVCEWPVHVWSTSIDFCLLTYLDSWGPSYQISRFSLLYSCGPHGCRANPRSPLFHCSSQRSNGLTEGHFHHKNPTSVISLLVTRRLSSISFHICAHFNLYLKVHILDWIQWYICKKLIHVCRFIKLKLRMNRVPTERRDGRLVSLSPDALNLLALTDSIHVLRQKFAAKGLNNHDLVTLVGTYFLFL